MNAFRILKPGGSLVTYAGQLTLPGAFREIELAGLKYRWIICVKHGGAHNVCHPRKVFIEWKPLLMFTKGAKSNSIEYIYLTSYNPNQ